MSATLMGRWDGRKLLGDFRGSRRRRDRHRLRPDLLDRLEDRTLLTTWLVNTNSDASTGDANAHTGSLRFDLANAASGDTIAFDATVFKAAAPQTISTSSTLSITKNLTITGPGTTIALISRNSLAGSNFPIFTVSSGVTASLSGLAIESGTGQGIASPPGGYASATGGGGIYNSGNLTVSGSALLGNAIRTNNASSPALGGAIYNDAGTLTVTGTTFAGNTADLGGAIYNHNGTVGVSSSTFAPTVFTFNAIPLVFGGNSATTGGALATDNGLTLTGDTVNGNSATGAGGGLAVLAGTVTVQGSSVFSGNTAGTSGGAIDNAGSLTVSASTISGNTATANNGGGLNNSATAKVDSSSILYNNHAHASGGGLYNSGTLSVDSSIVASNSLDSNSASPPVLTIGGGGLANNGGTATLTDVKFAGNTADVGLGGGAFNTGGTLSVSGSYFGPLPFYVGPTLVNAPGNKATDGAALFSDTTLTVSSTTISANAANENGGALYVLGGTASVDTGSLLVGNTAAESGGAIYNNADLTIDASAISANTAGTNGGGLFSAGKLTVTNSAIGSYSIYGGNSAGLGGGISGAGGTFDIRTSSLSNNTAFTSTGGAIDNGNFGFVTLTGVTLSGNHAHTDGGAIRNGGTVSIVGGLISNNVAENGSGGFLLNGAFNAATISGASLTGNSATLGDGGVAQNLNLGTLTILASTLSGNLAGGNGGVVSNAGVATISGSTLKGNTAGLSGGAFVNGGTLTSGNTTIYQNTAANGGGGATAVNALTFLTNVTVAGNTATGGTGGGLLVGSGSRTSLSNTLVAGNLAASDSGRGDIAGMLQATSTNNLVGDGTNLTGVTGGKNGNLIGTASAPINPRLGPLAYNGGLTQTLALLPGSPAIDAGSNLAASIAGLSTDQRGTGFVRSAAGFGTGAVADIGAFEVQNYVVDIADDSVADDGKTSLREALALANITPTNSSRISFDSKLTGPVTLNGGLTLGSNMGLIGPGAGTLTIQGGGASNPFTILTVSPGVNVLINGLTLAGGFGSDLFGTTHAGAIQNLGNLALSGVILSGNSADVGGAIENHGQLALSGVTMTGNNANMFGGALANYGSASVSTSTLDGNTSSGDGGAIENAGVLVIQSSTLSNNSATMAGGAIHNNLVLTIANTTLYGNSAGSGGGLAQSSSLGAARLTNATLTVNRATTGAGGGLNIALGNAVLNNTLVAGNVQGASPSTTPDDVAGTLSTASASNLFGAGGAGNLNAGNSTGNLFGVANPMLGALADNGGPTKTVALLVGSPAVDAGNSALALGPDDQPLTTDQRGTTRARVSGNSADIGAFELQAYVVNTLTDDNNASNTLLSLREAITKANADKQGLIAFSPGLTGTLTVSSALPTITGSVAIAGPGASTLTVKSSVFFLISLFFPNSVFSVGAGASASISGLTISGGNGSGGFLFFGNSGGGINNAGNLALSSVVVAGNTASSGGGINNTGTLTLTNSTVSGNTASTGAGINNSGTLTVTNSTISGNTASGNGGGINNTGTLKLVNSTLYGNTAGNGGGLASASPGTATLTNDTITANHTSSAFGTGGGVRVVSGNVVLNNTIVAGNIKGNQASTTPDDVSGLLSTSSASNLFGTGGAGGLTASNSVGNLLNVADAKLGPLADNGGPTKTVALLVGSPAIDAGDDTLAVAPDSTPLTTDQRGKARKVGSKVDIGAYESGA